MGCPGENSVVALAEGNLAPDALANVEAHVRICPQCGELLTAALRTGLEKKAGIGASEATGAASLLRRAATGETIPRGTEIGRYTILSLVGSGGMGEVYAAYDPELDRKVALKFLRANGARTPARGHARLLREAKALARISHRNVVAVHDAGTLDGRVFVAMEFVEGATLREWLAERPRTRDEVLAVFLEAAKGLLAAHAAGLVHRDFKPGNVMIAKDGGVRVTDFGLARVTGDSDGDDGEREDSAHGSTNLHATLTATGQVLGTPRYMAPEQFRAAAVDARTDQFSFCVALYEALYGEGPFRDGGVEPLAAEVLAGRVRPPPPKSAVPTKLRGVLLRGLEVDAAARWPSMRALVDALSAAQGRTRRRWGAAAGSALLAAMIVVAVARANEPEPTCNGGPTRLTGSWSPPAAGGAVDPRRTDIERAFLASGAPGAGDVWARVSTSLDRYANDWLAAYEDACAATHVRHEQSPAALDLRMACLDDRRTALHALTDVLASTDRDVVAKSIDAVDALPDVARCRDANQLHSEAEPPRDEATRKAVADLRERIARAKALSSAGKHVEAHALERSIIRDARALGYRPALVEAFGELATLYNGPVERPDVIPLVEEALWATLASDRADLAANAAIARSNMAYYFSSVEDAQFWLTLAGTLVDRAPGQRDRMRSWLTHTAATNAMRANDLPRARTLMEQAIAMKEKILPKGHPDIAISTNTLGEILHLMGKHEEALRMNQVTYDNFAASYGPASVEAAYTLSNRGEYLMDVDRPAEALVVFQRGLTDWEAHIGADHQNLGFPLTGLGRALVALGRAKEAIAPLERALRLRDPKQTDPVYTAETQFALAQALVASGDAPVKRALGLAAEARATYQRLDRKAQTAAIDAWTAGLQRPRHPR